MDRRDQRFFRKRLLITPGFQLALMAINASVITLVFAVIWIQAGRIFSDMGPFTGLAGIRGDLAGDYLAFQASRFHTTIMVTYLFAMITSSALTLIISYRFAGPLIRLRAYFEQLGTEKGSFRELSFRTGDYFSDLPPIINDGLKRFKSQTTDDFVDQSEKVRSIAGSRGGR
jgi:hypothetical protein